MTTVSTLHSTVRTPGWGSRPTLASGLAVVATAGVLWWLAGLPGVVLAGGVGLALFALPAVFVFALAQLALAVSLPAEPALVTVVVAELPLVVLLSSTVDWELSARRAGTVLPVGGGVLAASVGAVATVGQLWLAALLVVSPVALVTYGIHRYTVVVFDGDVDE